MVFIPVKTAAIEEVITIFLILFFIAANITALVPFTAGLIISLSFFGDVGGNGEATWRTKSMFYIILSQHLSSFKSASTISKF